MKTLLILLLLISNVFAQTVTKSGEVAKISYTVEEFKSIAQLKEELLDIQENKAKAQALVNKLSADEVSVQGLIDDAVSAGVPDLEVKNGDSIDTVIASDL